MADVVTFGPDRPPRRPSRRLIVAGVVVLAAGTAIALAHRDGSAGPAVTSPAVSGPAMTGPAMTGPVASCRPTGPALGPAAAGAPAALAIGCAAGASLDRRDSAAGRGPWTVVVRRDDGSLGRHGAVVTFPVPAPPPAADTVDVGGTPGKAGPGAVTWPVGGAYARVRGDLPQPVLVTIGAGTTIAAGRPAVRPPAGYAVAGGGPYRPPAIHEIRYGSAELGEQAALGGGLTYTGVVRGGGFEDRLYAAQGAAGGQVGGRPAVVSSVFGGNGTLAWEPAPGVVAYIGYSGAALSDGAVAALRRLAERSRPLDDEQWRATRPITVDQTNEPG